MDIENSIILQIILGIIILYASRFFLKKIVNPAYYAHTGILIIAITLPITILIPNTAIMNVLYIALCVTGASLVFDKFKRN